MKEKKKTRFALMLEPSLVEQVDTYRFASRITTRAEAIRVLIKSGLDKKNAATGTEIGVLSPVAAGES